MGLFSFLEGNPFSPSYEEVQIAKQRIRLEKMMQAHGVLFDDDDDYFLAEEYRRSLRNLKLFLHISRFDYKELKEALAKKKYVQRPEEYRSSASAKGYNQYGERTGMTDEEFKELRNHKSQ
jgi:hypothetical protein